MDTLMRPTTARSSFSTVESKTTTSSRFSRANWSAEPQEPGSYPGILIPGMFAPPSIGVGWEGSYKNETWSGYASPNDAPLRAEEASTSDDPLWKNRVQVRNAGQSSKEVHQDVADRSPKAPITK